MPLKQLRPLVVTMALCSAGAGCASSEPQTLVAQAGRSDPVDASRDNRAIVEQLVPGLIFQVRIDGNRVTIGDPELMQVIRASRSSLSENSIAISGLRDGARISTVRVADGRRNVQEHVGIVMRERIAFSVALPTPSRIDSVEIALPGQRPQSFNVAPVFERLCRDRPQPTLCR
jgi:hypothetical protein